MATRHSTKPALIPAVIYVRMSSGKQEASPDQQRAEVAKLAKQHGCRIVGEYFDEAISGDDTGGHIDGIARFVDANRVVVGNCTVNGACQPGDSDDQVYDGVAANLASAGFEVIRMDFDAAITYKGYTFDADYMNWGVGNGWVILVGFDNPATDDAAKAQLEEWFPNRDVYVIEMLESWIAGGGVHCHTNDQPIPVPEPSAWLLLAAGAGTLSGLARHRSR